MNKLMKILGAIVAVVVVLVVALVALASFLITPERVKQTVLPLAEENLNRKVTLGDIKVSLFSGIEIHDLVIYEPESDETFVASDLVRLRYQLLPLLAMKVVVDEVRLESPEIRIVRRQNGLFNFSDLIAEAQPDSDKDKAAEAKTETVAAKSGSAISLLVSQLSLQNGKLVFFDHVLNNTAPYRYELSGLQVVAKGVTLADEIPLSVQCQFNGSQLKLDGKVRLQPLFGQFEIGLKDFDVTAFKPYFQDAVPGELGGLKLSLDTKLEVSLEQIAAIGTLTASNLDLLLDALPDTPIDDARIGVDFDVQLDLKEGQLGVQKLAFDYNGIVAESSGTVTKLFDKPVVAMTVLVPGLDIRSALNAIPRALVNDFADLDPAGLIKAEARLSGGIDAPAALLQSAKLELDKVQATTGGQRPALSGRLLLTGDKLVSENLRVQLGDNSADIQLSAENLFGKTVIATADVSSKRFLLDPLMQGAAGAEQDQLNAAGSASVKPDSVEELGPFDIPLQATGSIRLGETVWKGLAITDFVALYELKNNIFTLSRMDGQVAGGSFSNSARIDLGKKGLSYSAQLGIKTIQADPLITALAPKSAGALFGAMDMTFALDGRGTQWQSLSRKLSGQGEMLLADGRLVSPTLINGLGAFLQLPDLNDIKFKNFQGNFRVKDGKLELDSQMVGTTLKLYPKGSLGLNGDLNMAIDTRLSPELSAKLDRKGQVAGYLSDQDGWSQVPLLLTGSIDSPSFRLDPKGVKKQATKALGQELNRQIDKLFKKDQPTQTPDGGDSSAPAEDPGEKLLKDSIRNLFGN